MDRVRNEHVGQRRLQQHLPADGEPHQSHSWQHTGRPESLRTIIRYGTVGTSPNRTWIADFEVDLVSGSEGSDDLRFQIQLHETSNLINVRFRNQQSATNGIAATIGYQGAGGASATTCSRITCNGKVMDDNRSDEAGRSTSARAGNVVLRA
jgi:hypothetical protein